MKIIFHSDIHHILKSLLIQNEFFKALTEDEDDAEESEAVNKTKELYRLGKLQLSLVHLSAWSLIEEIVLFPCVILLFNTKSTIFFAQYMPCMALIWSV